MLHRTRRQRVRRFPAIGDYAGYLVCEIVPFVDREFRTLASREHRGCFGKSSGGHGAMLHGMKYPRIGGAIADHSGNAHFEFLCWCDWPAALDELAKHQRPKRSAGPYDARAPAARRRLALARTTGAPGAFSHTSGKRKSSPAPRSIAS